MGPLVSLSVSAFLCVVIYPKAIDGLTSGAQKTIRNLF